MNRLSAENQRLNLYFTNITSRFKKFSNILSDKGLTKKASLNALTSGLDYFAKLVIGFFITPLLVNGLGDFFYGVWQVTNRIFGYISTTAGASSPLEWTLAKEQANDDQDLKKQFLASALIIWAIFIPITVIIGAVITWFLPVWLHSPLEFFNQIRIVAAIFVLTLNIASLSFMPYAILRGQNQGYRRIGISVLIFCFNGVLTWLAIYLNTGIIGISISYLLQDLILGYFYFLVCKKYIPWLGIKKPSKEMVKRFFSLSWWYLSSEIISNISFSVDVVLIGLFSSVILVPAYTLTKYIPETVITIIAILVVGIIPGLGGIIGQGDLQKASEIRAEIFSLTWLVATVIGTTVLIWNRIFLSLWVGSSRYAGTIPNLLIIIIVTQFVFIRTDGNIIDLTLRIQRKVFFGVISAIVTILVSSILIIFTDMDIIGACIGLIIGRLVLTISYPQIIGKFLNIPIYRQMKGILRPGLTSLGFYFVASLIDYFTGGVILNGFYGWGILIIGAGLTACIALPLIFYSGLSGKQRKKILDRFHILTSV